MRRGPVEWFWLMLGVFGALRFFLLFVVFGVLYLVMGNTAGRVIGAVMLGVLVVWMVNLARSFRKGV